MKTINLDTLKPKCECGGTMKKVVTRFENYKVRGWRCPKCKEELIDPRDAQPILKMKKLKSKGFTSTVGKVGNSLVVRIPSLVARALHVQKGEKARIIPKPNGIGAEFIQ